MQVSVVGAGIAGLCCALELLERGARVELVERAAAPGAHACSWCAGGMLAPWCELEAASEPLIATLGTESLAWWSAQQAPVHFAGTLVLAAARELAELTRFAQRTQHYRWLQAAQIAELEPELAGRFAQALYFPDEGHLDPRRVLGFLQARIEALGGRVRWGVALDEAQLQALACERDAVVDCRGLGARGALPDLRGVRGEMLLLESHELALQRPVRLLHPRVSAYLVPRGAGRYMLGATMIESDDAGPVSARSLMELLSGAYALHPAFGEARVLECSAQVRPALPDNLPRLRRHGRVVHVNGLFRHGFLIAPALAVRVAHMILEGRDFLELNGGSLDGSLYENRDQRRLA